MSWLLFSMQLNWMWTEAFKLQRGSKKNNNKLFIWLGQTILSLILFIDNLAVKGCDQIIESLSSTSRSVNKPFIQVLRTELNNSLKRLTLIKRCAHKPDIFTFPINSNECDGMLGSNFFIKKATFFSKTNIWLQKIWNKIIWRIKLYFNGASAWKFSVYSL